MITLNHEYSTQDGISQAINNSVSHDEITIVEVLYDDSLATAAAQILKDACDAYVYITDGDNRIGGEVTAVAEFWGALDAENGEPQEWRVHLHIRGEKADQ